MVCSVASLTRDISHTLHGADVAGSTALDYINQASNYLSNAHEWVWLNRPATRLALRGTITFSDGTWTESTLSLTSTGAFADYTWVQGDEINVISGTGAIVGRVRVRSRTDDNTIVLAASISSAGTDLATGDIEVEFTLPSVALPSDFGTIIALDAEDSLTISVHQTTLEELLRLRTNEIQITSSYYYAALTYADSDATIGGAPVPVLALWPAPATNDIAAFTLFYRAAIPEVTDDNEIVPIPAFMEMCYRQLVRAVARGYEHEQSTTLAAELAEWMQAQFTQDAMARDGMQQQHYGPLRGGAVETRTQGAAFTITTPITGPS